MDSHPPNDMILQKYSLELLTVIDEMRHKRDVLHRQILNDVKEKEKLQNDLKLLTDKLMKVNESICDKVVNRNRIDDTIKETEDAFAGLAVNSENLVRFIKKVTSAILPEIATEESEKEANAEGKKRKTNKKTEASKR